MLGRGPPGQYKRRSGTLLGHSFWRIEHNRHAAGNHQPLSRRPHNRTGLH